MKRRRFSLIPLIYHSPGILNQLQCDAAFRLLDNAALFYGNGEQDCVFCLAFQFHGNDFQDSSSAAGRFPVFPCSGIQKFLDGMCRLFCFQRALRSIGTRQAGFDFFHGDAVGAVFLGGLFSAIQFQRQVPDDPAQIG